MAAGSPRTDCRLRTGKPMHPIEALVVPLGLSLRKRRPDGNAGLGNDPDLAGPQHIRLTSPSFEEGGTIPKRHCGQLIGQDISPALAWSPLPRQTKSALLVVEDLDASGRGRESKPSWRSSLILPVWPKAPCSRATGPSNSWLPGIATTGLARFRGMESTATGSTSPRWTSRSIWPGSPDPTCSWRLWPGMCSPPARSPESAPRRAFLRLRKDFQLAARSAGGRRRSSVRWSAGGR